MAGKFRLVGQTVGEEDVYRLASMIHEKAKELAKDLEGIEKKKAKHIELSLKILCSYLKSRV